MVLGIAIINKPDNHIKIPGKIIEQEEILYTSWLKFPATYQ